MEISFRTTRLVKTIHNQSHMYQAVTFQQVIHSMLLQNGDVLRRVDEQAQLPKDGIEGMPHAVIQDVRIRLGSTCSRMSPTTCLCKVGIYMKTVRFLKMTVSLRL